MAGFWKESRVGKGERGPKELKVLLASAVASFSKKGAAAGHTASVVSSF
jgi:hypothetical protein